MTTWRRDRVVAVALFVLAVALGGWAASRLRVTTDITSFLPAGQDRALSEIARSIASSDLNRTITLTIEAPDTATAARAAKALGAALAGRSDIAWVRTGPDAQLDRAFYEAYFPHRLDFIAPTAAAARAVWTPESLAQRARDLRERLASPMGPFVRRLAPADPFSFFLTHLERLRAAQQGTLDVRAGAFVAGPGDRFGVVLLATRASPFDTAAQRPIEEAIDAAFARVDASLGGGLRLEQAGVHRIALRSEQSIRADITRVSVAGSVGVVLLLLLVFRSPRYLALALAPLVAGMGASVFVCERLFGAVHGLTLAFGATLIGVAIDYVLHYLNHQILHPDRRGPAATMRAIWPALALGAATTVVGLVGLAWTSFPGIREIAVFTTVGVVTALLVTRWTLPPFVPARPTPTRVHRALERLGRATLTGLEHRHVLLWALPIIAVIVAALGIPRVRWNDDVRALAAPDSEVLAEDARVRARIARVDTGRVVVALGDTLDEALARNDAVDAALHRAEARGLLGRHRSLHSFLWSGQAQRASYEAIPSDAWARSERALQEAGFVPAAFTPFRDALAAPFAPLTFSALSQSAIGPLLAPFHVRVHAAAHDGHAAAHDTRPAGSATDSEAGSVTGREAVLTFVEGVRDPAAVAAVVEVVPGVRWLDQTALMQTAYRRFRTRTLELVVAGLVAVFLLLFARYRDLRASAAAFFPAALAAGATLGLLGLAGVTANLLNVVTLLLVLSMGVDYGVFMVESRQHPGAAGATLVGLGIACASTVISFGALAMSGQPAMRAMGVTASIGITLSLVLAPAAWLLVRPRVSGS